jgi:glycine/D-amino acid oxidase-like deaminating enzyme/nitrite reductase/ring-hydroxylating ferredoxin subunit
MPDLSTAKPTSLWMDTVPPARHAPALPRARRAEITVDIAIIGGGVAGIWTAWELAKKGVRSVLIEKNCLATGDTGFSTAFVIRAPDTSAAGLKKRYGQDFLNRIFAATAEAQARLKATVAEERIDCEFEELTSYNCAYDDNDASLAEEWDAVGPADPRSRMVGADEAATAFAPARSAIAFDGEARYHVRKFLLGLLQRPLAQRLVTVLEDTEVTDVLMRAHGVKVRTNEGVVNASKVIVTTGIPHAAFGELHPLLTPRVSYVLGAKVDGKPFSDNLFWDTDEPYQYFRWFPGSHDTIIVGGADEAAGEAAPAPRGHDKLMGFIAKRVPGVTAITHKWSGSLFETEDGLPYIAEHPHYRGRVYVGTGFGGNGMVFGCLAGGLLANLATDTADARADLFDWSRTKTAVAPPKPRAPLTLADWLLDRPMLTRGLTAYSLLATLVGLGTFSAWSEEAAGGWLTGHASFGLITLLAAAATYLLLLERPMVSQAMSSLPAMFVRACAESELELGKPKRFVLNGRTVLVVKLADGIFAIDNVCGHAGGPLDQGPFSQYVVECPWHGSKFDVRTGAVVNGPATRPQRTYATRVEGGNVEVRV